MKKIIEKLKSIFTIPKLEDIFTTLATIGLRRKNWEEDIDKSVKQWGHVICKITDKSPNRRSKVLWFCSNHPLDGTNEFKKDDKTLVSLIDEHKKDKKKGLSKEEVENLISLYPNQKFYCSRMDTYLTTRTNCCGIGYINSKREEGYKSFIQLLHDRGDHYKAKYTLLISKNEYKTRTEKYPILCKNHNTQVKYSMQDLTSMTSCPCPICRTDPNHKAPCVDVVKSRNAGRPGQVVRHAENVKKKYNFACALSGSTFDLQHHHLDGRDFYEETALKWENNGICLCGTIHRDYHNNFLKKDSIIANEYKAYFFEPDNDWEESIPTKNEAGSDNPDLTPNGAEVSRYTFLEYLKFLIYDVKKNNSNYVNLLNKKLEADYNKLKKPDTTLEKITLEKLEIALEKYCNEYKAEKWALSKREDIPFANDTQLWAKVDQTWPV